jgi:hypothetical protein
MTMKNFVKVTSVMALMLVTCLVHASVNPIKSGVFGVCDCMSGNNKLNQIELNLKPDQTFTYIDNTNPDHKLLLTGTWSSKGNKIRLAAANGKTAFHRKWTYSENGQCIKSRHKLNFRRICLVKPC